MAEFGQSPIQRDPTEYAGQKRPLLPVVDSPRAPTILDRKYAIETIWRDSSTNDEWILVDVIAGDAQWRKFTGGGFGTITDLRADDGNIAYPNAGTIDVPGNVVAAATHAKPVYTRADVANTLDIDIQVASPQAASDINNAGIASFNSAQFAVDAAGFVSLGGGGLAIDQIDVDAATAPGTDPVLPTAAGQISILGAAVARHTIPIETHSRAANAFNIELQISSAITGAPANNLDSGICSFDDTMFTVDANGYVQLAGGGIGADQFLTDDGAPAVIPDGAGEVEVLGGSGIVTQGQGAGNVITIQSTTAMPGVSNIGLTYNAGTGTLTVCGDDGAALSATNRGFVRISSKASPGLTVEVPVTANQIIIDDVGASYLINSTFGTTAGRAWANSCPFFLYAVLNDAEDTISFMIHRRPYLNVSCAIGNMGKTGTVATSELSFFAFDDPVLADYDANPAITVGSFTMTKTAADDWTVDALDVSYDGIGRYQVNRTFHFPLGQNGAVAGYYTSNSGTEPSWTNQEYRYQFLLGVLKVKYQVENNTVAGVGANPIYFHLPLMIWDQSGRATEGGAHYTDSGTARINGLISECFPGAGTQWTRFIDIHTGLHLTSADLDGNANNFMMQVIYRY